MINGGGSAWGLLTATLEAQVRIGNDYCVASHWWPIIALFPATYVEACIFSWLYPEVIVMFEQLQREVDREPPSI